MPQPKVAIRLGTEGKAQVRNDFAEVGAAGDRAAKRLGDAFDRESQRADRARQKMASTAAKIALISSQTPVQMRINETVGTQFEKVEGSARRSAQAFLEAERAEAQLEARTRALMAAIDPAWAAQERFNAEILEAKTLLDAGRISTDQYAQAEMRAKQALDQATAAADRNNEMSGRVRAGGQQLAFQLGDMATMWSLNAKTSTIFATQSGQVIQAISMMSGGAGKFATFMAGPWGLAMTGSALVLGPLVSKLWEAEDAMDKVEFAAHALSDAQGILGEVFDTTTGKINTQSDALLAHARAQALDSQIQARARAADARAAVQGLQDKELIVGGGLGGGFSLDRQRPIEGQVSSQFLNQVITGQEAVKRLERLLSRGRIDESRFLEAAQAIANLGVERENIKVFAKALESLDSGELASEFRKPGRKTRGRTGLSNAERARQRAIEERADILSGFQDRFDPAAAIAREQADDLAALEKIRAIISPDEAALFEKGIRSDALKEMFKLDFPDDEKRQKAIANYAVGQAEALELAEKEFSLVGRSTTERERAMSILRLKLQLQREGIDAESEEGKRILANHELLLRKNEAIADSVAHWSETQRIGEQFIDKVLNPDNWNDWGDLGKSVLRDLEREFLRLAAINPLKNALFGTNYPTLGGGGGGGGNALIAGGVALLGRILGFASGTEYAPGGFATVGEHGPENVFLPRGSKVMNARESRRMNGRGGGTVNAPVTVNIDATGADSAELARTQVQLAQLQQSLPSQIVSTVNDARQRGFAH